MSVKADICLLLAIVLVCLCCTKAQDSDEGINLLREQVCYFPEYDDLIREPNYQGQLLNSSGYPAGLYIDSSRPSRCSGVGVMMEACAELRNISNNTDTYRMLLYLYRNNGKLLYERIGRISTFDSSSLTITFGCRNLNLGRNQGWIVKLGDVIGVEIQSECFTTRSNLYVCPAYGVFDPSGIMPNNTVQYSSSQSDVLGIADLSTSLRPGFVNVRALVVPTPPPFPDSCELEILSPICVNTATQTSESSRLIIGEVDFNPEPKRRFWGGGAYIMPQKVPTNGTVDKIGYTALLNTQGTNSVVFKFTVARMRELDDRYELLDFMIITIASGIPSNHDGFNNTIHRDSETIPNWVVEEGDQFAVFVHNGCTVGYCPANVNLLSNEDCESTLYLPSFSTSNIVASTISKTDEFLRRVPVKVNINISIILTDSIPPCSTNTNTLVTPATPTNASSTTPMPTTPSVRSSGSIYAIVVGAAILGLIVVVVIMIILITVIFGILRKQNKTAKPSNDMEMENLYDEVATRDVSVTTIQDIVVTPTMHVEVNERGRFRRRTMESLSQFESQRTRTFSRVCDYSRIQSVRKNASLRHSQAPLLTDSLTNDDPTDNNKAVAYKRVNVANGTLSANYQMAEGDYSVPVLPADKEEDLKTQLATLGIDEIPKEQLQFEENSIGSGQFGTVYRAVWEFSISEDNMENNGVQVISAQVAVKVMDNQRTTEDRIKFLQEVVLLGQFNDPNIVAVFGVVTRADKLMMICELMDEDLKNHLSNINARILSNENTEQETTELPALLLSYCRKIASSFVYLGLKGFVHRDLAARNILVSKEGDCKLSDFGLSRQLRDEDYYLSHGGMVPVKWTATEALMHRRYSTKSDVWSYGILLYEIWSLGGKPYPGMTNQEVVTIVPTGYRLPPPPGCPRAIYDLIIKCTHPQPESRPAFTNILTSLQRPDYQLLKWRAEDVVAGSEAARTLGAPLEEGEGLYTELQKTYKLIDSTD